MGRPYGGHMGMACARHHHHHHHHQLIVGSPSAHRSLVTSHVTSHVTCSRARGRGRRGGRALLHRLAGAGAAAHAEPRH
eukprot:4411861-Prymnesium_polylepis.1